MAQFRKDRFRRGTYNKFKWRKIGPCNILRKFSSNAYEVELPKDVYISPIFNMSNFYPYHADKPRKITTQEEIDQEEPWEAQLPKSTPIVPDRILDKRTTKKTKSKEYYEYLIKWMNHSIEDSTWMTNTML